MAHRAAASFPAPGAPETYFGAAHEAFEKAAHSSCFERFFRVGPAVMRLRFAGPALLQLLTRALSHIAAPPTAAPDFTICCWDSASTGIAMLPPPWPPTAYGAKGRIEGFNTDRMHALYQPGTDILHLFDREKATGIYWVATPETIPYWEQSFPMRAFIHWWSRNTPLQLMHAGAVGLNDRGVLLAGKSGSGKSTTALACLDSNLTFASDDYVLAQSAPNPFVYSLYATAKLVPDNLSRLPAMASRITNAEKLANEKALIYVQEHFPEKISAGFSIKAIFLPRVTGEKDTKLTPASSAESLFALAPTTVMHLEGHSRLAFEKMGALVRSLPSFWLELGTDMPQIPATIREYLMRND